MPIPYGKWLRLVHRRALECAGIQGHVGAHLGVHFRNVGVHGPHSGVHNGP